MDSKFLKLLLGQSIEEEKSSDDTPDEQPAENQSKNSKGNDQSRKEQVSNSVNQAGEAIGRAPQTYKELQSEWQKDHVPFYFMVYSTVVCGGLLYILYLGQMKLFYGIFAVYAATMLPVLYIYEETILFSPDQNEYIRQQRMEQAEEDSKEPTTEDITTDQPETSDSPK